jgi:hypothetical protein
MTLWLDGSVESLASLDTDLESSTTCALRWLTLLLDHGSLLLFDDVLRDRFQA